MSFYSTLRQAKAALRYSKVDGQAVQTWLENLARVHKEEIDNKNRQIHRQVGEIRGLRQEVAELRTTIINSLLAQGHESPIRFTEPIKVRKVRSSEDRCKYTYPDGDQCGLLRRVHKRWEGIFEGAPYWHEFVEK